MRSDQARRSRRISCDVAMLVSGVRDATTPARSAKSHVRSPASPLARRTTTWAAQRRCSESRCRVAKRTTRSPPAKVQAESRSISSKDPRLGCESISLRNPSMVSHPIDLPRQAAPSATPPNCSPHPPPVDTIQGRELFPFLHSAKPSPTSC
jgi:hypothetical protein